MTRTPAVFIGHGSPMNTLERNRYTDAWAEFGRSIERPTAILAISAHWYVNATAVTAMAQPRTIHDFGGFPDELFAVQYPAPGDPDLAARVAEVVKPTRVIADTDKWGLDHGTWSVLAHMFPDADVPVVQLSIDATRSIDELVRLGAALAPLRDEGVLVLGSGNVVHNLREIAWRDADHGEPWALEFDDAARVVMTERPADLPRLAHHPQFRRAAPTPDHFLPLAYVAGLAAAADTTAEVLLDGCTMGSLSMTSYVVAS
jgi:4,5-DOPA dioxygenase extradiol